MGKKILITGAVGFVGSRLAPFLVARGHAVVASEVDVLDRHALDAAIRAAGPELVIHLAAISHVPTCERDPALAIRVNLGGTATLLEVLRHAAPRARLVFTSTAQVYQAPAVGETRVVMDEARAIAPQNLYARTKWQSELLIADACTRDGLRATVLRLFNHTHRTQSPDFFLPHLYKTIRDGLAQHPGERLAVPVGNLELSRDIGSLDDLLAAFAVTIERDAPGAHEVFNVCSGTPKRLATLAAELARRLHAGVDFVTDPTRLRPGEPESIHGSHARLTEATGWLPRCVDEATLLDTFLLD